MSQRELQHSWEAVRSQIKAQMARCEGPTDEQMFTADERHIFRVEEAEAYYGPTRAARAAVNRLFGLDAEAGQAEWEAILHARADDFVAALGNSSIDTEARSAVALLLLDFQDRAAGLSTEMLARIRWHLRADARVQSRMRYWWTHMDGSAAVMSALS